MFRVLVDCCIISFRLHGLTHRPACSVYHFCSNTCICYFVSFNICVIACVHAVPKCWKRNPEIAQMSNRKSQFINARFLNRLPSIHGRTRALHKRGRRIAAPPFIRLHHAANGKPKTAADSEVAAARAHGTPAAARADDEAPLGDGATAAGGGAGVGSTSTVTFMPPQQ